MKEKIYTMNIIIVVFDEEEHDVSIFNNSLYNIINLLIDIFNFFFTYHDIHELKQKSTASW